MALEFKTGVFTASNSTGDQTVAHGMTGTPTALILFSNASGGASGSEYHTIIGAATGATERWVSCGGTGKSRTFRTDACYIKLDNSDAVEGEADFVSFDGTNFTINWSDAIDDVIHFAVLNSSEAKALTFNWAASTGSASVTGAGFEPKVGMFSHQSDATAETIADDGISSFGWVDGASSEWCIANYNDAGSNSNDRATMTSAFLVEVTGSGITGVADFTSWDSDGFTYNSSDAPTEAKLCGALLLGGDCNATVGDDLSRTSTGTFQVVTSQQVVGLMIGNTESTSADAVSVHAFWNVGAYDGTTDKAVISIMSDGSSGRSNIGADSVVLSKSSSGGNLASAVGDSLDSDGFTLDQVDADTAQRIFGYVAFFEGDAGVTVAPGLGALTITGKAPTATVASLDTITVTDFDQDRVYPMDPADSQSFGTVIAVAGTYAGTAPDHIQARVMDGIAEVLTWTTIDASPTGGTYSGTLSDVDAGSGYTIEARSRTSAPAVLATDEGTNTWGIGYLLAMGGQSNGENQETDGTDETANALLSVYEGITADAWDSRPSDGGNGVIALGNQIITNITGGGIPVGVICAARGNANAALDPNWLSAGVRYVNFKAAVDACGSAIHAVLWIHGEFDSDGGATTQSEYVDGMFTNADSFIKNCRSDFGNAMTTATNLPILIVPLGRRTSGGTDSLVQGIRAAEVELATDVADVERGAEVLPMGLVDSVHFTNAEYSNLGQMEAQWFLTLIGEETQYLGPKVASFTRSGATVTINLTHRLGTDFTPASGAIDAIEFLDDGTPIAWDTGSPSRTDATTVTGTLVSLPTGVETLRVGFGAAPTITNYLRDNSTETLGLDWLETLSSVSTSLDPGKSDLIIAGLTPTATVAAPGQVVVTPAQAALAIAGIAPAFSIAASANVVVAPDNSALLLAGIAPAFSIAGDQIALPDVARLTLTGVAPSESHLPTTEVLPGVSGLSIAGFAPTHSLTTPLWVVQAQQSAPPWTVQ